MPWACESPLGQSSGSNALIGAHSLRPALEACKGRRAARPREGAAPQPHDVKPDARVGQAQHVAFKGAALARVRAGRQPRQVRRGRHRLHLVKVGAVAQDLLRGQHQHGAAPTATIRTNPWSDLALGRCGTALGKLRGGISQNTELTCMPCMHDAAQCADARPPQRSRPRARRSRSRSPAGTCAAELPSIWLPVQGAGPAAARLEVAGKHGGEEWLGVQEHAHVAVGRVAQRGVRHQAAAVQVVRRVRAPGLRGQGAGGSRRGGAVLPGASQDGGCQRRVYGASRPALPSAPLPALPSAKQRGMLGNRQGGHLLDLLRVLREQRDVGAALDGHLLTQHESGTAVWSAVANWLSWAHEGAQASSSRRAVGVQLAQLGLGRDTTSQPCGTSAHLHLVQTCRFVIRGRRPSLLEVQQHVRTPWRAT